MRIGKWELTFAKGDAPKTPDGAAPQTSDSVWAHSAVYTYANFRQYNPDDLIGRRGYGIIPEMMTDEQLKAVVFFRRNAVTGRRYTFQFDDDIEEQLPEEERDLRKDVMSRAVSHLPGAFKRGLDNIMTSLEFGFSITEPTYKPFTFNDRAWWGLRGLTRKPQNTFYLNQDEYGVLKEIEQVVGTRRQKIDPEKIIHHVHNASHDPYYGRTELREAYRAWYTKDVVYKLRNIFLERLAGGFVWAQQSGPGANMKAGSPDYNALQSILGSINTKTGMLLPPGVDLNVEMPKTSSEFAAAIADQNKALAKALLMPNLLGLSEQGQTGSYSQSSTQLEAFLWMLDAEAIDLEETINEQLVQRLGDYNFGDGLYPRFRFRPLSQTMLSGIVEMWNKLVQSGAVEPTDSDEEHWREAFNLPPKGNPLKKVGPTPLPDTPTVPPGNAPPGSNDPNQLPDNQPPDPNNPPGNNDPAAQDQTVVGKGVTSIEYDKHRFDRAVRRVNFAAIDKSSELAVWDGTARLAKPIGDFINGVLDQAQSGDLLTDPKAVTKLTVPKPITRSVKKASLAALKAGWDLGHMHAQQELRVAGGSKFSTDHFAAFASVGDIAAKYLDAKAFTMTGNLTSDALKLVQQILVNGIKYSKSFDQVKQDIYTQFAAKGMIDAEEAAAALGEALDVQNPSARLDTVIRTNTFDAMNEARYALFTSDATGGFVTDLEYSAILDGRTTPICRELGGEDSPDGQPYVAPKNASQWDSLRPPNHFNCRSLLIAVTQVDNVAENVWQVQNQPQEGFG